MASTKLTRTLSGNGNQNTATWSFWVKRSSLTDARIYNSWSDGSNQFWLMFSSNKFNVKLYQSSSYSVQVETNRLFRDTSAWYHIVVAIDTTQGTASDRIKIYVNGIQETSLNATTYPSENQSMPFGLASYNQRIGFRDAEEYFDGSMSHFHFCDGTALAPTVFGETDSTTGEWKIKTSPSFTLGTNGFTILKDGNTITDQSTNSNNWTLAAGTLTKTEDCPDNNFATMNPLDNYYSNMTFSQGNNTTVSDHPAPSVSTLGMTSGKYYFEAKAVTSTSGNDWHIGIVSTQVVATSDNIGKYSNDYAYYGADGNSVTGNSGTSYGNTYTAGDIIGCAVDLTNNKLYFSKNGTWQNSGVPTSGGTGTGAISITAPASTSLGTYLVAVGANASANSYTWSMNFGNGYFGTTAVSSAGTNASGNGIFEYDVPTGYTALSTKGLNL